jgi:hypothetical protein
LGGPFLLSIVVNWAIIDETVKVAKKFLEDHPEEAGKYGDISKMRHDASIGASFIAKFLGWNKVKVTYSLERLNLIDTGATDTKGSFK